MFFIPRLIKIFGYVSQNWKNAACDLPIIMLKIKRKKSSNNKSFEHHTWYFLHRMHKNIYSVAP